MITSAMNYPAGNFRIEYTAFTVAHSAEPHYAVRVVDRRIEQTVSSRTFLEQGTALEYLDESVRYYTSTDTLNRYPHILEN